ncbi:UDP-glucuronosyl/UDP-glucosyltransferase, partial [Trinorchestia longiramus]
YHAVPALFLPVFGDQHTNAAQMVNIGVGETMLWNDLTEETLRTNLLKLLNDPKYEEAVTKQSVIMRDQPLSPEETVIYWTEYVIRHKGAPHLRSPFKDLTWYQVYNLD